MSGKLNRLYPIHQSFLIAFSNILLGSISFSRPVGPDDGPSLRHAGMFTGIIITIFLTCSLHCESGGAEELSFLS